MNHIIETIYYNTFYQMFTPIIIIIAILLFIILIRFFQKTKKTLFIFWAIILAFIIYQGVPYYFTMKALTAKNDADVLTNYRQAARTSCFSAHKGFIYADLASYLVMEKNGVLAIKFYDLAYKYLKNHESIHAWADAPLIYILNEEYDKAIDIANTIEQYSIASTACILKEDYISALDFINKALDKKNDDAWLLGQRAVIYKNLDNFQEAETDYLKALDLCCSHDCTEKAENSYGNYDNWYKEYYKQKRIEYGF